MNTESPAFVYSDVVVCGGGTAGAFAAIAAAEQGKSTLVIEQFGALGGTATNGLVTPVMHSGIAGNPQGSYIYQRLIDRLQAYGSCDDTGTMIDPVVLRIVLEELCIEAGVKILYHTLVADVRKDGNTVTAVEIVNKGGKQLVKGRVFIDATGDGDVSVLAGAAYTKGNPETGLCQPMSLRYMVGGIDMQKAGEFVGTEIKRTGLGGASWLPEHPYAPLYAGGFVQKPWVLTDWLGAGVAAGELTELDMAYWQVFCIPGRHDALAFNCPEFFDHIDGTDPNDLTLAQLTGKKAILRQMQFYKKHWPGFENAYIAEIAPMVGVRESREIQTEYVLTARDVFTQRKFPDMFCQSNYHVDIHGKDFSCGHDGVVLDEKHPWYEIPYRTLVVKGLDNLLVAGRCIGTEFVAQSSTRVQHSCRSSGECAGIAAAMAIDADLPLRALDGGVIREKMISLGAKYHA